MNRNAILAVLLICSAACTTETSAPEAGPPASAYQEPPATLEGWNLFTNEAKQEPGPRTFAYQVIAPLFSDYATKRRFMYVPEGGTIGYDADDFWNLPTGSILIKTFSYPADLREPEKNDRLLETRLLVFTDDDVQVHTYVWDEAQRTATRKVAGTTRHVEWTQLDGAQADNDYTVPNTNQCFECHGKRGLTHTLGLRTRQLDRDEQLEHWDDLGLFDRTPDPSAERDRLVDPFGSAPLADRARSYLDANCAQCHTQGGDASKSGMWIDWKHTAPSEPRNQWGVCKRPTSASGATCGNDVDIAPGEPERSIYMCRLQSTDPKVQMPPLGRNLIHDEGVQLIHDWIAALPPGCD